MPYYKIKIHSFDTKEEKWIVFYADDIYSAIQKAHQLCVSTNSNSYPFEQSLHEITRDEYINLLGSK